MKRERERAGDLISSKDPPKVENVRIRTGSIKIDHFRMLRTLTNFK